SFKIIVKGRVYMIRAKELFIWEPSFLTCKEKEYVSDDEFVRETSNNNDGQPPHDEVFGDVLSSDDEGFILVVSENNNMNNNANDVSDCNAAHTTSTGADNIDPKPQVDAPLEQSCEQVGSQTIKSGESILEIMEGIIQVGKSMGYTMEGCAQNLERIIGQQGESNVFR
nr:RNA-directed DNA polymerase, eukaryota [Tanacetum cinerariifolium]